MFDSTTLGAVGVIAGVSLNKYLSLEGEYQVGVATEQHDDLHSEYDSEVKLNHAMGGYVVASLPISPRFSMYVRGGAYKADIDRTVRFTGEDNITAAAGSIGGGFAFHIQSVDVRLSFTHHEFDDIGGANSVGLIAFKRF